MRLFVFIGVLWSFLSPTLCAKEREWKVKPSRMDNFTQFIHPLQNETSTKTCLDSRVELDNSTYVKLGVRSWGSSQVTNAILAILIQEVLGVKTNILDFHEAYADFVQTYGSASEPPWDWSYYMREGYIDVDAENWDENIARDDYVPRDISSSGLLGYVGKTGWYITSEMLAIQRDLNSYAAYRYPETASLFNPNKTISELLKSTSDGISISITNAIENNINSAYCNNASPQFSVQNCLNVTLYYAAEYQNASKALGTFYSPGSDWSPRDNQIITNLGLKLKLEVLEDPIEQNILGTLKRRHAKNRPWIGYMYSPHSIFFSNKSGISLSKVQLPEWSEECEAKLADGKYDCEYSSAYVKKFVRSDLYNYSKPVAILIEKFKLNELEMTQMLALMDYDNMSAYDVACWWVKENERRWKEIMPYSAKNLPNCPAGTELKVSPDGEAFCVKCAMGTYNRMSNSRCLPCPLGGLCPGGSVVNAAAHYWQVPDPNNVVPQLYYCENCCNAGNCTAESACEPGYTGTLCSQCIAPNSYSWNGKCHVCDDGVPPHVVLIPLFVAFLLTLVLVIIGKPKRSVFQQDLLLFYQLASVVLRYEDLQKLPLLGIFQFDVESVYQILGAPQTSCVLPFNNLDKLAFKALAPFILWGCLGAMYIFCLIYSRLMPHHPELQRIAMKVVPKGCRNEVETCKSLHGFFGSRLSYLFMLTYMPIFEKSLRVLRFRTVAGRTILYEAADVAFFRGNHIIVSIIAIFILCVWGLLIPLIIIHVLSKFARQNQLNDPRHLVQFGFFYTSFREEFFLYGAYDIIKRALIVMVSVVLPVSSPLSYQINTIYLFLVVWFFTIEHGYMKPCVRRLDNWLRLIIFNSILAILATSFMASDSSLTDGYGTSRIGSGTIEEVEFVKYGFLAFFLLVPLILIPWQILSILLEIHRAARQQLQRKKKISSVSNTSLQFAAKLQYVFTPPVLKIYSIFADAVDPETLVPFARTNTIRGARDFILGQYKRSSGKEQEEKTSKTEEQHKSTKWSMGSLLGFRGSKHSEHKGLAAPNMKVVEEVPESWDDGPGRYPNP